MAGKENLRTNATKRNEKVFLLLIKEAGLPEPQMEVKMVDKRRFRIDYAWPDIKLGVEIQGGVYTRGAHGSIYGILSGYTKANIAACNGWRLLYYTPQQMTSNETINQIREAYQWSKQNGSTPN